MSSLPAAAFQIPGGGQRPISTGSHSEGGITDGDGRARLPTKPPLGVQADQGRPPKCGFAPTAGAARWLGWDGQRNRAWQVWWRKDSWFGRLSGGGRRRRRRREEVGSRDDHDHCRRAHAIEHSSRKPWPTFVSQSTSEKVLQGSAISRISRAAPVIIDLSPVGRPWLWMLIPSAVSGSAHSRFGSPRRQR